MKPPVKLLSVIYVLVLLLDLALIYLQENELRWFSKPMLMPLLMFKFYIDSDKKNGTPFNLVLAALFLSWCGDLLLQAKNMFIPGLISFLLAHVIYILYFKKSGKNRIGLLQMKPMLIIPVLLYIVLLLVVLYPYLQELKIPVIVYSITIGVMLLMAMNTRHQLNHVASCLFITGALLFVLSDSLLAINLFVVQHWVLSLSVMATYATAQYLIVKGAVMNK